MIHVVPLLFGVLCGLAVWRCTSNAGALTLAIMLAAYWGAANMLWQANGLWALPVMDLAIGLEARILAVVERSRWLDLFLDLVALRLALHIFDALTGSVWQIAYLHALNFTFMLMLFALILPGGGLNGGHRIDRFWRRLRGVLPAFQTKAS